MRNKIIFLVAILILITSLSACSGRQELSGERDLALGIYRSFPTELTLKDDGSYVLWGSIIMSAPWIRTGRYTIENERLLLWGIHVDHVFTIENDRLIFESGTWLEERFAEPGAIFHLID